MKRVFICYSRKDSQFVDKLMQDFLAAGVFTWRDVDQIPNSIQANTTGWRDAVNDALSECADMIVIVSPNSMLSDEVKREAQYFQSLGKPIYVVLYSDTQLPYWLHNLEWRDLREYSRSELSRLITALQDKESRNKLRNRSKLLNRVWVIGLFSIYGVGVLMIFAGVWWWQTGLMYFGFVTLGIVAFMALITTWSLLGNRTETFAIFWALYGLGVSISILALWLDNPSALCWGLILFFIGASFTVCLAELTNDDSPLTKDI